MHFMTIQTHASLSDLDVKGDGFHTRIIEYPSETPALRPPMLANRVRLFSKSTCAPRLEILADLFRSHIFRTNQRVHVIRAASACMERPATKATRFIQLLLDNRSLGLRENAGVLAHYRFGLEFSHWIG